MQLYAAPIPRSLNQKCPVVCVFFFSLKKKKRKWGTGSLGGGKGHASPSVAASSPHSRRSQGWTRGGRLPGTWPWWRGCSGFSGGDGWSWCLRSSPCRSPGAGLQSGGEQGKGHSTVRNSILWCSERPGTLSSSLSWPLGSFHRPRTTWWPSQLLISRSVVSSQCLGDASHPQPLSPQCLPFLLEWVKGPFEITQGYTECTWAATTCSPHQGEGRVVFPVEAFSDLPLSPSTSSVTWLWCHATLSVLSCDCGYSATWLCLLCHVTACSVLWLCLLCHVTVLYQWELVQRDGEAHKGWSQAAEAPTLLWLLVSEMVFLIPCPREL